mgnify:CR=1 FL=1
MKHGRTDYDERIQDKAAIIPEDEPVFLIRGQDRLAARMVRHYADLLEGLGEPFDRVEKIRQHALTVHNWRPKKTPDVP